MIDFQFVPICDGVENLDRPRTHTAMVAGCRNVFQCAANNYNPRCSALEFSC